MKILFLDDNENRHKSFGTKNIGRLINHVYSAAEAIKALSEESFDIVSLDHDLAYEANMTMPDRGDGSGYDVAMFISEMDPDKRPATVIIHSWNPPGCRRMLAALKDKIEVLTYEPFSFKG